VLHRGTRVATCAVVRAPEQIAEHFSHAFVIGLYSRRQFLKGGPRPPVAANRVYDSRLDKASRLKTFLPPAPPGCLDDVPLELFLFDDAQLSVIYAPVDFVNTRARIVLAGLTPSWKQARAAYAAHAELRASSNPGTNAESDEATGLEIQRRSAFAGTMRRNLVAMLDELGIQHQLGIASTQSLFGADAHALHATSVLRHPVFKAGKNYSGQHPKPLAHPFLRAMLERLCAPELARVEDALIVPLGKAAEEGLEHLTRLGALRAERVLRGFPHPSAANAHRKVEFARAKPDLEWQVRSWFERGSLPPARFASEWQEATNGRGRLAANL
jgi:hypothetical protein